MDRADNFNRADSTTSLGAASDGLGSWTANAGTWGIGSNQGRLIVGSQAIATLEASTSDAEVAVTLADLGSVDSIGLSFRVVDGSNYLMVAISEASNNAQFYRCIGGSFSGFGSVGGLTIVAGDRFAVRCEGDQISLKQNGVEIIAPVTQTQYLTATRFGLRSDFNGSARFEDFAITDLSVGPPLAAGTASFGSSGPAGIAVTATAPTGGTGAGPTYQWERNADGGAYSDLVGATTLTPTDATAVAGILYRYRCKQTRGVETVTTNAVAAQVYSGGAIGSGGVSVFASTFIRG